MPVLCMKRVKQVTIDMYVKEIFMPQADINKNKIFKSNKFCKYEKGILWRNKNCKQIDEIYCEIRSSKSNYFSAQGNSTQSVQRHEY